MNRYYKCVFLAVWLLLLALGPIAVLKNPLFLGFKNNLSYINFLQRAGGLMLLTALSLQLFLQATGCWNKYHRAQGMLIVFLLLLHPLTLFVSNFLSRKILDPFYVFSDFCLLCETKTELFYSLGRAAFWLGIIGLLAVVLRRHKDWKNNWKIVHSFFYLAFILAAVHAWFIGSDLKSIYYLPLYVFCMALVLASIIIRVISLKRLKEK